MQTTSAGALTTSLQYDSAGELTKTILPTTNVWFTYAYDNAHRLTTIANRFPETQNITYNSAGNVTQTQWKNLSGVLKRQHSATFDALGRMLTDVGGVSQTTTYGYDSQGNVTTITDPLSHVAHQTFDALNRLKSFTDAATDLTQYSYDAHDRPLTVTDPRGKVTSYVYNGFGDLIQQTSPDSGTTVWYYDPDSNVTTKKDGSINYTSATYDALDRPLTRTYPADSSLNVAYTYDQSGHGWGIGHLTSMTDPAGCLSRSYDERGNITGETRTMGTASSCTGTAYTTGYGYNNASQISTITYPGAGWVMTYSRNNAGAVTGVTATQPSHSAVNVATGISHLPFGPLYAATWGNSVVDARTFDLDYRMTRIQDTGTAAVQDLTYGYDADNNVHTVTDAVTTANNQTLGYDVVDRLTSATGIYTSESIQYDSSGNRKNFSGTGLTISSTNNWTTKFGGSTNITYSSTGNMTAFGTSPTMTYSKANRLATTTVSGTTSTYTYDGFGQRTQVQVGAGTPFVQQYGQDDNLLMETSGGAETDYVYVDGTPVATIKPSTAVISALHTDNINTPQKATSSTQTLVWSGNYTPFGQVSPSPATIVQNLRRPGQYADSTGLYHNGFRDQFPTGYGQYIESDPIGLPGGNISTYPYAMQNPLRFVDPWGLITIYKGVPPGSVIYAAPNGTQFYAPSTANFQEVQNYGRQISDMLLVDQKPAIGAAVGQGGIFDYQRSGDTFYPAYTNASNYAVGVLMQGAGYSQWQTDLIGGTYATLYSQQGWTSLQTQWWNSGWIAASQNALPSNSANSCKVSK